MLSAQMKIKGPPTVSLNLIVLRARHARKLSDFYSALGLEFKPEKHGQGPTHYSAHCGETILEIYPCLKIGAGTASLRLGFDVESIGEVHRRLRAQGAEVVTQPHESPWGMRAVFRDPEGHTFELREITPQEG